MKKSLWLTILIIAALGCALAVVSQLQRTFP